MLGALPQFPPLRSPVPVPRSAVQITTKRADLSKSRKGHVRLSMTMYPCVQMHFFLCSTTAPTLPNGAVLRKTR